MKALNLLPIFLLVTCLFSFEVKADLVQINQNALALQSISAIAYDLGNSKEVPYNNWKITNELPSVSPWGSGFVIDVKEGLKFSDSENNFNLEENDFLSWLYPNGTTFKAVYILTNHHVWSGYLAQLQSMIDVHGASIGGFTVMVTSVIELYDNSVKRTFQNTYFPGLSPVNQWGTKKYWFTPNNMGLREIINCYEPNKNMVVFDNLKYPWGCDFTLIRMIVPSSVPVRAEKIAQNGPAVGDKLTVWFKPFMVGSYITTHLFGNNNETFIADIDNHSYVATPGWSGSPVLDRKTNNVVGIIASGWPGINTKAGGYSIDYIMKNLNVKNNIEADFNFLKKGWTLKGGPYKGNFYGKSEHQF